MEFFQAVIRPTYWITHQHPVPEEWKIGLTVFFGLIVLIGLLSSILALINKFKKPYRHFFAKLAAWGWTMGLIGYILLFFSIEQVSFISARLFYLFWAVIALWWLFYILKYAIKDIPRIIDQQKKRKEEEKYLPKKKK
jgi:hypothetical protein